MASSSGSSGSKAAIALVLTPLAFLALVLGLVLAAASTAQASCGPGGAALSVDPSSVPEGPVAGYNHDQLVVAAALLLSIEKAGGTSQDQQLTVMAAMGESSLTNPNHGDQARNDTIGVLQIGPEHGSLAERMDVAWSARNFLSRLRAVEGYQSMEPTLAASAAQRNADPEHYRPFWEPAGVVLRALAGVTSGPSSGQPSGTAATGSRYNLGQVQPSAVTVANTVGPMFGIKTVGGYRPEAADHTAGLAIDFMINDIADGTRVGDALAAHLLANADQLSVKYVIWKQRIWSPDRSDEGWRAMPDRGSVTENHFDHVHLSLTGNGTESADPTCSSSGSIGEVSLSGWAAPATGPITSGFGHRPSPGGIGSTYHRGQDFGPGCDAAIWAANAGQVVRAGPGGGLGNVIEVDHGQGLLTRYGHMFSDGILVRIGDRVTAGQQIARVGNSGNSTGCHLHFEVLVNGEHVDPKAFLDRVGVTITN